LDVFNSLVKGFVSDMFFFFNENKYYLKQSVSSIIDDKEMDFFLMDDNYKNRNKDYWNKNVKLVRPGILRYEENGVRYYEFFGHGYMDIYEDLMLDLPVDVDLLEFDIDKLIIKKLDKESLSLSYLNKKEKGKLNLLDEFNQKSWSSEWDGVDLFFNLNIDENLLLDNDYYMNNVDFRDLNFDELLRKKRGGSTGLYEREIGDWILL